jgi:hypothetical protein
MKQREDAQLAATGNVVSRWEKRDDSAYQKMETNQEPHENQEFPHARVRRTAAGRDEPGSDYTNDDRIEHQRHRIELLQFEPVDSG